jgi:tRNA dimethylallyltransferase
VTRRTPPRILIAGPTASGKTGLAIAIAERIGAEIVSADAMQVYQGMEIGTAAPAPEEQARVPHHLVSIIAPDRIMTAGQYQRLARRAIAEIEAAGKPAVITGGSGLYISALTDGLFEGPVREPAIRARLKAEAAEKGNAALMDRLHRIDPEYAAQLSSENDLIRIIRALEVHEITGETFSELHRRHQARRDTMPIRRFAPGWDRQALYDRINRRVNHMIENGWAEEVRALLNAGHEKDIYRIKALGFREIAAFLQGKQSLEEAVEATKMHHRRYAKRQISWFRGDDRITWVPASEATSPDALAGEVLRSIEDQPP